MNKNKYPQLEISLNKITSNYKHMNEVCCSQGIDITTIIKGVNGLTEVADLLHKSGSNSFGSSRLYQLKNIKKQIENIETMLIRIPMITEVEEMVKYVDISLNSEETTLDFINEVCNNNGIKHKVILMCDLGDLREGIFEIDEVIRIAKKIEYDLENVILYGIGTNLSCLGSIVPTVENLSQLVNIALSIEAEIGRRLEIISGGGTTSLPLVFNGEIPERINHLRVGEGILLARDLKDYFKLNMNGFHTDTFVLHAEVVEVQIKPSYPIGTMFIDAFGNKPYFEDKGMRKRAIVAIGNQDIGSSAKLIPRLPFMEIVGSSSDHVILDYTDTNVNLKVGDIIDFELYYQAMLFLTGSNDVCKVFSY